MIRSVAGWGDFGCLVWHWCSPFIVMGGGTLGLIVLACEYFEDAWHLRGLPPRPLLPVFLRGWRSLCGRLVL